MKAKSLTAVALIFAVLFSLCACRKLDGEGIEYEIESEAYIVDDEGVTYEVESEVNDEGETEYYYTDNSGNVISVKGSDITIETRKVAISTGADGSTASGETTTLPEEAVEFINSLTDPAKEDEYFVENDAELEIEDGAIDTDNMKEETIATNSDGVVVRGDSQEYFNELTSSNTYTIGMTIMSSDTDGTTTTINMTAMRDGDNMYVETSLPMSDGKTLPVSILAKDGKCIMYMKTLKAYMEVPSDTYDTVKDDLDLATDTPTDSEYQGSGQVTLNGKTYDVDIYTQDGTTLKYYYLDDQIRRVEAINSDGSVSIIEYTEISDTVDSSKFKTPSGYFNMTDIMDSDAMSSLFG